MSYFFISSLYVRHQLVGDENTSTSKRLPHYLEERNFMSCIVQAKVVPRSICDGFGYPVAPFCFENFILF